MSQFPKFDFSTFERKLLLKTQPKTLGDLGGNVIDFIRYFKTLNEEEKTELEERVAIMEYDGGLSRLEAEKSALNNIIYLRGNKNDE